MTRTSGQSAKRTTARTGPATSRTGTARKARPASRKLHDAASWACKIAGVAGFVLIVVLGVLYVRILQGPISLGFLTSRIEQSLAEEFPGLGVQVEGVYAQLNAGGTVEFELKNIQVSDGAGTPLAFAPSAAVSLSSKALLAGRIAPESINLISPRLLLYYSDDGALSVKFSPPAATVDEAQDKSLPLRGTTETVTTAPDVAGDWTQSRIDLVKALSEASARLRRREHAGAFLREVGLKSATVILDHGGRKSIWRVRDLEIDLDHRRSRSSIAGQARIESLTGPWELHFRTFESESAKTLELAVSIQGLVPRGLARSVPQFGVLEGVDMPVWVEANLSLSNAGEILSGKIGIDAAPGTLTLPWLTSPLRIDGGHFSLTYSSPDRRFEIQPSVIVWGDSRVQFTGQVVHAAGGSEGARWVYDLRSAGGWLGAEPPIHPRLTIDDWRARGFFVPEKGRIQLAQFALRAGGSEVTAQGDVIDLGGTPQARLDGKLGPMKAEVFKSLWPAVIAPKSREWVGQHLLRGNLQGGTFKLASGTGIAGTDWAPGGSHRVAMALEGADLSFNLVDGWPALDVPRGLLRLEGTNLEITAPDASMTATDGRRMGLKGSLTVDMAQPMPRTGHISFRAQGPLSLALEMIDQEPFRALQGNGASLTGVDGKVEGQLTVSLPLGQVPKAGEVRVEGKAKVVDGRLKQAFGQHDVTGANIAVDLTGTAIEGKGDMLISGVLAKAAWQHIFGAAPEKQPPLRVVTTLDNSDRTQLGLDINDLVSGEVGLELLVSHTARNERNLQVRADLVNAEIFLESVAWRKPKGKAAIFQFDVVKGAGALPTELHNVKLVGDGVAVEGWMGIGPDHKLKEFRFPQFTLNYVGSLKAEGKLRTDTVLERGKTRTENVWDVVAEGATYDGRDVFRSFFDVGRQPEQTDKVRPGLDLRADIGNVVGFSGASMRQVHLKLQKRGNKMVMLDARGTLEGGKPFAAVLKYEPGEPRRLRADAGDAGQLFKVVGFYPNAFGGQMNLEVNLDGQGVADRVGTLWARDFYVLGDPIVSEVFQTADGAPASSGKRTVVREKIEFNTLRIPFSVGHGQFVMNEAYIKGPLIGATMRGKVDFRSQRLQIGGTFVPLFGVNSWLAPIPLLGPLLTGPRGEGIFAMTFVIQGDVADPQVVVNPFSLITPGIFREIMQLTPEDPKVLPPEKKAAPCKDLNGARSSSTTAKGSAKTESEVTSDIGAGWSAEATEAPKIKKK